MTHRKTWSTMPCDPEPDRILVIGIGNPARGDDALGWTLLDLLEPVPRVALEYRYQLQVEDAELISRYQTVVFVDASMEVHSGGYAWNPCQPDHNFEYTSHAVSPGLITALCETLYGRLPETYVLAISGKTWELGDGLTEDAIGNLERAREHLLEFIGLTMDRHCPA